MADILCRYPEDPNSIPVEAEVNTYEINTIRWKLSKEFSLGLNDITKY